MLERQRKETIIRLIDLHKFTSVHEVVEATGASESTIRRDFIDLENEKKLLRVRGGVQRHSDAGSEEGSSNEPSFDLRTTINQEKKRRIAKKAVSLLNDGETIFIDGGTTTFQMVEFLSSFSLTVVTNSFAVANHLIRHSNCTIILPEGIVDPESQLIMSNLAPDPFQNYAAAKAFMGIQGITVTSLTNSAPLIIQSERAMIAHSQELIILADDSKFGHVGSLTLCPVEKASKIITTKEADPDLTARLSDKGIEIIKI
ncbi:MAG: DeoR/GlpR transcriptional regulator [Spirochaetaceae bacterium]|nr:DeoR/GlpR transcriptional regulator [Spirochaetaceae bacterium]